MKEEIVKSSKSITALNYTILVFLIYINGFFYMTNELKDLDLSYYMINLFVLVVFFILNKRYEKENRDASELFNDINSKNDLITKDYEDLKDVLSKFIPESFLAEVEQLGTDKISLGLSVKKYLNVMFLDIIGFTTITEKIPPDRVLLLLNLYFDGIVKIINSHGGYVDKFLGDGIMVIFNGIEADSSIKAAIEIQNFVDKFQVLEIGGKLSVGIGINSGEVILGTIGSSKRMEITIIGDVVNTAARIEGLTRECDSSIIIGESTFESIENKKTFSIKEIGLKDLKGKSNKTRVFGIEPIINLNL